MRFVKRLIIGSLIFFVLICSLLVYSNFHILNASEKYVFKDIGSVPEAEAALVPGALVLPDGSLYAMTKDRADMAIMLYKAGKVKKILVSGDHGHKNYDEVNTIRNYILNAGIPVQDIFMDHAGFNTYASMYRARDVFKVKSLIVCTQRFHIYRAVYLARTMGIDASGMVSNLEPYSRKAAYSAKIREKAARLKAFLEAEIFHPKPHFLGAPIPITGDGKATEDGK